VTDRALHERAISDGQVSWYDETGTRLGLDQERRLTGRPVGGKRCSTACVPVSVRTLFAIVVLEQGRARGEPSMRVAWDIEHVRQLVARELASGRFESLRAIALRAGVAPRALYGVLERSLVMTPEVARGMAFFFRVDIRELVVIDGDSEQKNESGLSRRETVFVVHGIELGSVPAELGAHLFVPYVRRSDLQQLHRLKHDAVVGDVRVHDVAFVERDVEFVALRDPADLRLNVTHEVGGVVAPEQPRNIHVDELAFASAFDVALADQEPAITKQPIVDLYPDVARPVLGRLVDDDFRDAVP
jgi:hypothetical protein